VHNGGRWGNGNDVGREGRKRRKTNKKLLIVKVFTAIGKFENTPSCCYISCV